MRVELVAPHGWGNPAGRVNTPASPALPLDGAGRTPPWPLPAFDSGSPADIHPTTKVGCLAHADQNQGRTVPARCLKGGGTYGRAVFLGPKDSTP